MNPEALRINDAIPALLWLPDGPGPHGAIVSVHGGGGNKGDVDPRGLDIALKQGVAVLAIDAYRHGERQAPGDSEQLMFPRFVDTLAHTAPEIGDVVAYLKQRPEIDPDRIGLRGGSMGGYIVLAAAGLGVDSRGLLSICGAADYESILAWQLSQQDNRELMDPAVVDSMWRPLLPLDPLLHADRFPPRAMLMIHGARDPLVPIAGHRALYDALVPLYADRPEDLTFITHAGDHATPPELEAYGWRWLAERLNAG